MLKLIHNTTAPFRPMMAEPSRLELGYSPTFMKIEPLLR
jgi:hypothetical protein